MFQLHSQIMQLEHEISLPALVKMELAVLQVM
jgi:hypothetical protein